MTDVVAALIWDEDRFLICQRPAHKARGLLWEFVGGKVEPGETPQQALIRECREELAITVEPGQVFMELIHEYPDLTVRLVLFHATIKEGIPRMLEHNDIRWIKTEEIDLYDFCPADVEILARLKQIRGQLQIDLLCASDPAYQSFQCALMPTVDPGKVLGVRMPALRKLAASYRHNPDSAQFVRQLPHKFFEEDNLHGLLINEMEDFGAAVEALDSFLPYVDNWATCDLLVPKSFRRNTAALQNPIHRWLQSDHTYTVRFALGVLMRFYLMPGEMRPALDLAASVRHKDYYVNMMVAWLFATALTKDFETASCYLINHRLSPWIHNKTIQKAIESRCISDEEKSYLRTLKIKHEKRQ